MAGGGMPGIPRLGETSGGPWFLDIIASSIRKVSMVRVSGGMRRAERGGLALIPP